jgi:UDP-glucose 4-epimerase
MTKKILISGSSGQVGSCLVEHFSKRYNVLGLDVKKSGIPEVDRITTLGDIRDKDIVNKLVKDVDAVIHTAAQLNIKRSLENPILDADINIMGTLNLLDAARKNKNISKFVYLSSSVVYGNPEYLPIDENHPLNPVSAYGLSKLTGEKYCFLFNKVFGLPIVCVRPFNIYGSREDPKSSYVSIVCKFTDMVRNNKPLIIYGDGKQMRDLVHVKDVASFIEIVLEKPETAGVVYNLGSGKPVTVLEIAKLVLKMNGKDEKGNIIYEKQEKGKIEHSYADIKKSVKIGYKPKITLDKGINEIINFYKSN